MCFSIYKSLHRLINQRQKLALNQKILIPYLFFFFSIHPLTWWRSIPIVECTVTVHSTMGRAVHGSGGSGLKCTCHSTRIIRVENHPTRCRPIEPCKPNTTRPEINGQASVGYRVTRIKTCISTNHANCEVKEQQYSQKYIHIQVEKRFIPDMHNLIWKWK